MLDHPLVRRAGILATTLTLLGVVVGGLLFLNNMRSSLDALTKEVHELRMTQGLIRNEMAAQTKALADLQDHMDDAQSEQRTQFLALLGDRGRSMTLIAVAENQKTVDIEVSLSTGARQRYSGVVIEDAPKRDLADVINRAESGQSLIIVLEEGEPPKAYIAQE